jgi:hypothetical protein
MKYGRCRGAEPWWPKAFVLAALGSVLRSAWHPYFAVLATVLRGFYHRPSRFLTTVFGALDIVCATQPKTLWVCLHPE